MLVDLNESFWIDDEVDGKFQSLLILGFSIIAEIQLTKKLMDTNGCDSSELLIPTRKYTSIFNGFGNTPDELDAIYDSEFSGDVPIPRLFPAIGQSDDLDRLKNETIRYLELQFSASKPSKSDLLDKMKKEDEVLSSLVQKYMSMFTIKNELN